MISKKTTLFTIIFTIFVVFGAQAQPVAPSITIEQAQTIHQAFQTKLDELKVKAGNTLRFEGELLIEPVDTYYAVTLPHIYADHKNGEVADLGIVALNLVPTNSPEKWMVSMALPTQISVKDKAGEIISKMTIKDQNFSGTWDTKLSWFETMQSTLGSLVFSDTEIGTDLTIEELTMSNTNDFGLGAGKLNTIGKLALRGLSGTAPEEDGVFSIGNIAMNYDISGFDFSYIDELKKSLTREESDEIGEFEIAPVAEFDEMQAHFVINDFKWATGDQESVTIASMATKGTYAVREAGLMDSDTQIDVTGMKIGISSTDDISQWIPQEFSSHVQISNFPRQALSEALIDSLPGQEIIKVKINGKKIKTKELDVERMKAAFVNAGTEYKINSFTVKTPIGAGIDITGQLAATEGAPYVATGNINLGLTGLGTATSALQKMAAQVAEPKEGKTTTDIVGPMMAQQGLMGIMMVQGFGKSEKNAAGQTVTRFEINLPREGGVLINGQDIGALMGMMGAGAPAQK